MLSLILYTFTRVLNVSIISDCFYFQKFKFKIIDNFKLILIETSTHIIFVDELINTLQAGVYAKYYYSMGNIICLNCGRYSFKHLLALIRKIMIRVMINI